MADEEGAQVGLHLNLSQRFDSSRIPNALGTSHDRIVSFMLKSKYAMLLYNPLLRSAFRDVFQAQYDEFVRLFGRRPTHIDGHQHRHQCVNMLIGNVIPQGEKVHRNFSFSNREKNFLNRAYRSFVDHRLSRRYCLTDSFFALSTSLRKGSVPRIADLARSADVELMTPLFGALHLLKLGRRCLATGYKKIRGLRATALEPVRAMPKTSQSQTGASTKGSNNGRHKC